MDYDFVVFPLKLNGNDMVFETTESDEFIEVIPDYYVSNFTVQDIKERIESKLPNGITISDVLNGYYCVKGNFLNKSFKIMNIDPDVPINNFEITIDIKGLRIDFENILIGDKDISDNINKYELETVRTGVVFQFEVCNYLEKLLSEWGYGDLDVGYVRSRKIPIENSSEEMIAEIKYDKYFDDIDLPNDGDPGMLYDDAEELIDFFIENKENIISQIKNKI